ncbi:MAG: acetyl-CoA C-acyltransferase [Desulfobacterales bacterium]|nr:acetyl-CoA C-acyltransferase [Desulfobacterales bacterium]MBF0395220.1 acetyl-CoA C-acyltransferase [Desulfobacterales bacterium]
MNNVTKKSRAVIVGGVRTPFVKSFGVFMEMDTIALGATVVKELLKKYPIPWKEINSLVWGGVILPTGAAANIGREIVFDSGIPPTVDAITITRVCTSGLNAITLAAAAIERGEADVIIAGGSDSTSNTEVVMPKNLVYKAAPVVMSAKSTMKDYFQLLWSLNLPDDIIPKRPSIRERTTGELMGEAAEKMAIRNNITRIEQDKFALQSHKRAAKAIETGRFAKEVIPVDTPNGNRVYVDNIVRGDTTIEKLSKLSPAFSKNGTLTAGNSSSLTDGACAVLVMNEEKAKSLGFTPLAAFRSWSYGAVDPRDQLLIGPAFSMPDALIKAGMSLKDIDLIDVHEAFAAQVLSVIKMIGDDEFAKQRLNLEKAFGIINPEDINVHGGSIALGHPFAATGARMALTMANEFKISNKATALLGICGAGGVSAAAVLEAV